MLPQIGVTVEVLEQRNN